MNILPKLIDVLQTCACDSQGEIVQELKKRGLNVTQASVSRGLAKLGAIKALGADGRPVYRLHKGISVYTEEGGDGPTRRVMARHLVERIIGNGSLYIVLTKASSGRFVAEYIDDAALQSVGGTIAGGNTVFVAPYSAKDYAQTGQELSLLLGK